MPDVIYAVQQYVNGYIAGSANNRSSTLTVIVGTNSSGIWVNHDTGQAWAQMIFGTIGNPGLQYWAAHLQYNNNPQHVYIAGGIDIESGKGDPNAGWRSPSFVNQWLSGYASTYNSDNIFHLLYYFGNAAGC